MAFIPQGGGGGSLRETVLWTNPNPTATSFNAQNVTLSDDMNNYDYIAVDFAYNNQSTRQTDEYVSRAIMSVADFKKGSASATTTDRVCMVLGVQASSGNNYARLATYRDDTTVYFLAGLRVNAAGSAVVAVPLKIVGLK